MLGLGPTELIIIAVIILLIFGAKRLPGIGKGLGETFRELSNIKKDIAPEKTAEEGGDDDTMTEEKAPQPSVEAKIVNGVLDQIPGVKKIRDIKKKAEKVKKLME